MQKTLSELASIIDGKVVGDGNIVITGFSGLKDARNGDLTFLDNKKYIVLAAETEASAIITSSNLNIENKNLIVADNPSLAFTNIISELVKDQKYTLEGVHGTAIIAKDAEIGKDVAIGPNVIIGHKTKIGDNAKIFGGCYIGNEVIIGANTLLDPNITVLDNIQIGSNVIIHSSTVIGADGFGFIQVNGRHKKIPQIGTVVIEDDVEIGSNVSIDRARFNKTLIGKGTKIDNLVQVAHNVVLGENCIIISQVGISGSVTVEKNSILAGQVGVVGHLTIGEGTVVASRGVVTKSIPPNSVVSGNPAKDDKKAKKINACVQRLPLYVEAIHALEDKIKLLEEKLDANK